MVVVVGGGVVGLCTALYVARQGRRVVLVEKGGPDGDSCSLGNAGMLCPSHVVPLAAPGAVELGLRMLANPESAFALRLSAGPDLWSWLWRFWRCATPEHVRRAAPVLAAMHLHSRAAYQELAAETGNAFGLEERGILMLCATEAGLREELHAAAVAREVGITSEVLDPRGLVGLDSAIRMTAAGGVYFPGDCHLVPMRLVAALQRLTREAGVEFRWGVTATGWRRVGSRAAALITSHGEIGGDEFIIAGGSRSALLAQDLGVRVPLQGGKGYSFSLPAPKVRPCIPAILVEARVAVTPMDGGLRFAGMMELGASDARIQPARARGLKLSVARYYPDLCPADFQGVEGWSGLRPCSPDGLPYVGRIPPCPNVLLATGHAMMGVSLAPVTGRVIAALLAGETPPVPIEAVRPERFA